MPVALHVFNYLCPSSHQLFRCSSGSRTRPSSWAVRKEGKCEIKISGYFLFCLSPFLFLLQYAQQQAEQQLQMARNSQGLHAPFRLKAEWAVTSKVRSFCILAFYAFFKMCTWLSYINDKYNCERNLKRLLEDWWNTEISYVCLSFFWGGGGGIWAKANRNLLPFSTELKRNCPNSLLLWISVYMFRSSAYLLFKAHLHHWRHCLALMRLSHLTTLLEVRDK